MRAPGVSGGKRRCITQTLVSGLYRKSQVLQEREREARSFGRSFATSQELLDKLAQIRSDGEWTAELD